MSNEWVNWSGSIRFQPEKIEKPENEEEIHELVKLALAEKKNIRMVGSGHSSMPLVKTDQLLVSLENYKGLIDYDSENYQVKILPGTNIEEAGKLLINLRMTMPVTGDVDFQHLGGAFGTGTHGSGKTLQNLPSMMVGCRLIDGTGSLTEFTNEEQPEMMEALRVSLGALGIFTELTLQAEPAKRLLRREYCTHISTCMDNLDELVNNNLIFDFYWYPRTDEAKIRTCNPVEEDIEELIFAEKVEENEGWMYEILPQKRTLKFEEMEYALPIEAGPDCFREVRKRIKDKHRHYVGWRVFYRTIAADDGFLSPFYKRDSVTIAILQNNQLEYKKYFEDIEPIFRAYGGRPHWGKKHGLKGEDLKELYPEWDKFLNFRSRMDPEGIFLNDHLKELFGL